MTARFSSQQQGKLFDALRAKLAQIGYRTELLETDYRFSDWFVRGEPEREAPLAAFGQTPPSYDTACFAVLLPTNISGIGLVEQYRALGAPYAFEVYDDCVHWWTVGKNKRTTAIRSTFTLDEIDAEFAKNLDDWLPDSILRAKNISYSRKPRQLDLFDYTLIPELEGRIKDRLDPIVQDACSAAVSAYRKTSGRDPDMRHLFKLAFWMLAGKVFHDRGLEKFQSLTTASNADDVLERVAKHYREPTPRLLNVDARDAVRGAIWANVNFRNLSIDVLTQIWTETFVTPDVRKQLGIHATPRSVAKFIVDSLPFEDVIEEPGTIVEPCSGSGTFLVAALQRMRDLLPASMPAGTRHALFKRKLIGFEKEAIGIEISRLCLTLADYPNPNGWQLFERDVFSSRDFSEELQKARVILCNPPFEDFGPIERKQYGLETVRRPLALLRHVLSELHPKGMIGFVMPRLFIDGDGYAPLRQILSEKFGRLRIVALPDNAFPTADSETALVIASDSRETSGQSVQVSYAKVRERDWDVFSVTHQPSLFASETKSLPDARVRLSVPPLANVWKSLKRCMPLGDIARIHRGIEWNKPLTRKGAETGSRDFLVSGTPKPGFRQGIPPKAKFDSYESPPTAYLSMRASDQRAHSFDKPWDRPKVIMNKATKSRGEWRVAAVSDFNGLVFYQTFTGIWPNDSRFTMPIEAILNGPVANALISTHEGKVDITADTVRRIPIPELSDELVTNVSALIEGYRRAVSSGPLQQGNAAEADAILRKIDAIILEAYDLSARTERELLDYFGDSKRQVPFEFARYFPLDFEPCYSLTDYLSDDFSQRSAEEFRNRYDPPPTEVMRAIAIAARHETEE